MRMRKVRYKDEMNLTHADPMLRICALEAASLTMESLTPAAI